MISGITVIGDIARPNGDGSPGGTDRGVVWLFDAVKRQVHRATGLPVDVVTTAGIPGFGSWLDQIRPRSGAHRHWASVHDAWPPCDALNRMLLPRLRDRFCICYEQPPWARRLLTALNIPHIDIRVHPVRFLDDLLFAVRSSEPTIQETLSGLSVPESEVLATAGLREAMCHMISSAAVPMNTLIVLGQRPLDSSQIVGGTFFDAIPLAADIEAICARYAAVILKPHPLEPDHGLLHVAASVPNAVGAVNDNLYRLMSLPEIAGILTVNSSAAYEAPYFNKTVHTLAPLPIQIGWRGAIGPDLHASIDDRVLSVDFWRTVLAPHTGVTPMDGARLTPKPNRLRIALDSFWNFQEIDTDRIP